MKRRILLPLFITTWALLAGCATTDELTQKEKDKLAREQARAQQKQATAQEKKLEQGLGGRKNTR
ncbi:MAG: hypothetical protein RLZZ15_1589 [Verrucomicrobiota bacterium]|jgi:starvation-inducible outer membrane lipoprotein